MSDFKAKMHQIVCRLGLRFRPRWGELITNAPQAPSWILGGLLLREGRGGEGTPCFPVTPPATTVYIKAWFNRYCYVEGFVRMRSGRSTEHRGGECADCDDSGDRRDASSDHLLQLSQLHHHNCQLRERRTHLAHLRHTLRCRVSASCVRTIQ